MNQELTVPCCDPPGIGEAIEVADGVLWSRLPVPMALDHINVFALRDGDGWTVVDTGVGTKTTRAAWQALVDGPLRGVPIRRVIVTHHHPDHIGLAGWMQAAFEAELLTTRTAWLFARMLTLDEQAEPAEETLLHWRRAGMPAAMIEERAHERPFNFADVVAPLPLGFTRLVDGQSLFAGGRTWTIRFGQGHAPDHAVLFSQDEDLVIAGDQYLPSISPNLGVYATEPEADPVSDWITSHRALRPYLTDTQLALPGHGLPFRGLPFRADQLIDNHNSALARLSVHLAEPRTATECFDILYRRKISAGEYTLALVEAMAHCLSLWHAGKVTRELGEDGAWRWHAKDGRDERREDRDFE